jgi:hypothetical protein
MDALQELVATNALMKLKARYFYYLDNKMWDEWAAQFTADSTLKWDMSPNTFGRAPNTVPTLVGREAIKQHLITHIAPLQTVHQGHTPIFTFHSDTEASGIWAMEDIVESSEVSAIGHGHYHETYRKEADGEWRFVTVHLTRLRVVMNSRGDWPARQ